MRRMLVLAALCAATACAPEKEASASESQPATAPARGAHGEPVVRVDRAAQERLGLRVEAATAQGHAPQLVAAGRVVSDPAQSWELRAPVAGSIRAVADWPELGRTFGDASATVIGYVEPRLSVVENADLLARRAQANGDLLVARASLAAAEAELARLRRLNADDKNVSDRALEEAQVRVETEEARRQTAVQTANALEVRQGPSGYDTYPLRVEARGEVVDVRAQPGESVDAGASILRVERFDPALVRIELPIGESVAAGVSTARVVPIAHADRVLEGRRVALVASAELQGQALLLRVSSPDLPLRPGDAVTAYLDRAGAAIEGVLVPRSAVVRHAGKAWVYVQTQDEEFAREEIALAFPTERGWIASEAWTKAEGGARLVVVGAQSLLSTEILSAQGGAGGEGD